MLTLLACVALLLAVLAGVAIGETPIAPGVVLQVLANKLWPPGTCSIRSTKALSGTIA